MIINDNKNIDIAWYILLNGRVALDSFEGTVGYFLIALMFGVYLGISFAVVIGGYIQVKKWMKILPTQNIQERIIHGMSIILAVVLIQFGGQLLIEWEFESVTGIKLFSEIEKL